MMDLHTRVASRTRRLDVRKALAARYLRKFRKDEDGSMIVFGLFLIVVMLIVGGMAVDFMRFESRRTLLQSTADRATLAAANITNTPQAVFDGVAGDPKAIEEYAKSVAIDYFAKAGLDSYLVGDPIIDATDEDYRSVEVNVNQTLDTFFLHLAGVEEIEAGANSRAVEGVGNVEISLVLDISGSMREETTTATGDTTTKIAALRTAATSFVNAVLADDYKDKISVSLVPYSQHVSLPKALYDGLTTNDLHDFSYCVDFTDADFDTTEISTTQTYTQGQHIEVYGTVNANQTNYLPDITTPSCLTAADDKVTVFGNNRTTLANQIAALVPRGSTSIFLGMKWGVGLLDPSTRDLVAPFVPGDFAGRPVAYPTSANRIRSNKVIVLMTDGSNQPTLYMKDDFYSEQNQISYLGQTNFQHWYFNYTTRNDHPVDFGNDTENEFYYTKYSPTDGDTLLSNICKAARDENIEIFTIAFEAPQEGQDAMLDCATDAAHYYNASGAELTAIFNAIADQVTDLRLTK